MGWSNPLKIEDAVPKTGKVSAKVVREALNMSYTQFNTMKRFLGIKPPSRIYFWYRHLPMRIMVFYASINVKFPHKPKRWVAMQAMNAIMRKYPDPLTFIDELRKDVKSTAHLRHYGKTCGRRPRVS